VFDLIGEARLAVPELIIGPWEGALLSKGVIKGRCFIKVLLTMMICQQVFILFLTNIN